MSSFYLTPALLMVLLLVEPGLRYASGSPIPESRPVNNDLSQRVHLISASNPQFDALLQEHFPAIAASAQYETIKATSVIVANDTRFRIKAFTLRWTVVHQDGSRETSYTMAFPEVRIGNLLPGRDTVLEPNHFGLASPVTHLEETSMASRATSRSHVSDVYASLDNQYSNADLITSLLAAKEIQVTIDGLVFGTGVFVGKDKYGLLPKFTCERNGAIDEALAVKTSIEHGESVQATLERDIATGLTSVEPDESCLTARGREASRLLELLRRKGSSHLEQAVARLSQAQRITLHRLPSVH